MNVQDLVAQTFDEGALNGPIFARIGAEIERPGECGNTRDPGLTTTEEWLHE